MKRDDVKNLLQQRWPTTFTVLRPLKVGIFDDVAARLPNISPGDLRAFFHCWTRAPGYLAALVEGAPRVDLAGNQVGVVSKEEEAFARLCLQIPMRKLEDVEAEAQKDWHGDDEKVATTTIKNLIIADVEIISRHNKAHEYEVLSAIVTALPSELRSLTSRVFNDSKAGWVISITLRRWDALDARRIANWFERLLLKNPWALGHSGISVFCTDKHKDKGEFIYLEPHSN